MQSLFKNEPKSIKSSKIKNNAAITNQSTQHTHYKVLPFNKYDALESITSRLSRAMSGDDLEFLIQDKDGFFSLLHAKELLTFIQNHPITSSIILPAHKELLPIQRVIDTIVFTNRFDKNKKMLTSLVDTMPSAIQLPTNPGKRPYKKRTVTTQISHQKQQQVQVSVSFATQHQIHQKQNKNPVDGLDFEGFYNALVAGELQIHSGIEIISQETLKKQWHTWLGDILVERQNNVNTDLLKQGGIPEASVDPVAIQIILINKLASLPLNPIENTIYMKLGDKVNKVSQKYTLVWSDGTTIHQKEQDFWIIIPKKEQTKIEPTNIDKIEHKSFFKQVEKFYLSHSIQKFCRPNKLLQRISKPALEQLLNHNHRFKNGLSLSQLPKGFHVIAGLKDTFTLHYDLDVNPNQTPLAPVLTEPTANTPMPACVIEEIMRLLPDTYWLKDLYIKSQRDIDYLFFRTLSKYLPLVLSLTPAQAQALMTFCCDKNNRLDANSLNYVLAHYKKIAALIHDKTTLPDELACHALNNAFPEKSVLEVITLVKTLSAPNEQGEDHILHALLVPNNGLDIQVKHWLFTEIGINQVAKDACLEVYAYAGVEGLKALYALWAHPEFSIVYNLLKSNDSFSFIPFIKDPSRFTNALNSMQGFKLDKTTYAWWSTLLEKHLAAVGYDDLYTLVESFVAFKKIIEEGYGLSFYEGVVFDDVKSMPTALSNMLTLLRECKQNDRQCQWDCISTLSLHSNGAIRASIDRDCGFVTPQMQAMPEGCDKKWGYYSTRLEAKAISDPLQWSPKHYYRYLAHTHQRLPLPFYTEMDIAIANSDFTHNEKSVLYSIVAISTSGDNTQACANTEKMKSIVEYIFKRLRTISLPSPALAVAKMFGITDEEIHNRWKAEILNSLDNMRSMPLPMRQRLLNMYLSSVESVAEAIPFMTGSNKLQDAFLILNSINYEMLNAANKSMHFYPENIHTDGKESLLVNHTFTALALLGGQGIFITDENFDFDRIGNSFFRVTRESREQVDKENAALVSLVSHFGLANLTKDENIKNADDIYQLFQTARTAHFWEDSFTAFSITLALKLLYNMDKQPLISFTAKDLKAFIQHFIDTPIAENEVPSVVKKWFGNYFPNGYFEALEAQKIPEDVLRVVQKTFKDEDTGAIKRILCQFISSAPSIEEYTQLIQKIATLHNAMGLSQTTGQAFLAHLSSPALLEEASFVEFDKLLSAIGQYKSLHAFLFFAEKAAHYPEICHTNLVKKATFYLQEGFPAMPAFASLSNKEAQQVAMNMILHADAQDLIVKNFEKIAHPIDVLCKRYPSVKETIFPFLMGYVTHNYSKKPQTDFSIDAIRILGETFDLMKEPHLILSICANTQAKNANTNPSTLLAFLQSEAYENCLDKKALFTCLAALLNNNVDVSLQHITTLISHPKGMEALGYYKTAPYPSLENVLLWLNEDSLQSKYAQFEKNPYPRDEKNTFNKAKALEHAGFLAPHGPKTEEINKIIDDMANAIFKAQQLSMAEIKDLLSQKSLSHLNLLVLTTELLTRTTGAELNTTQYLATYILLKSGKRSISAEIATGEGKSRIAMLLAAADYLRGQTVDVITKDMALAERDYLSYHAFFKGLGAPTGLIYSASTEAQAYKIKGINFSVSSELANFRGEAITQGMGAWVIDSDKSKRTVLIDEVDHILFALSDTEFNVAMNNNALQGSAWVYENMVDFFYKYPMAKEWDNATCNPFFRSFVQSVRLNKSSQLADISDKQLNSWIESALTAFELKFNAKPGFVIATGIEKETAHGLEVFSEAQVYDDCRADAHSTFTAGVHQFLHARLNWLKKHQPDNQSLTHDDKQLVDYFKKTPGSTLFQIKEEEIISFSSTSYDLMKDYDEGKRYGLTGTFTTPILKKEAHILYDMDIVPVPRHNALQRIDHPVYLVSENKREQIVLIKEQIIEAQNNGHPVLLINKNDAETNALRNYLGDLDTIRWFSAYENQDEAHYIKNSAGQASQATVSTGMHGRGTDINLSEEAKLKGLRVFVSFMPESEEEMIQIFGRAGRQGQLGEAQLLLNKEDLKKQLGKTTLTDGFYTATETYLNREQAIFSRKKQLERLIKYSVKHFQYDLQKAFYTTEKRETSTQQWAALLDATNKVWQNHWDNIQAEIGALELTDETITRINQHINAYKKQFSGLYQNYLKKNMPEVSWAIPDEIVALLKTFALPVLKTTVAEAYHPAHDGKAILYTRPFEKLRAVFRGERPLFADFRAWWNGRGILCPNLRAWWHGHMTADQFLYGCSDMSGVYQKLAVTSSFALGFITSAGIGAILLQFTSILPLLGLTTILAGLMGPVAAPIVGIVLIILIAGIVGLAAVGIAYGLFKLSTSTADAEPIEPEVNAEEPLKESYSLFGEALGVKPYPLVEVQQLEENCEKNNFFKFKETDTIADDSKEKSGYKI